MSAELPDPLVYGALVSFDPVSSVKPGIPLAVETVTDSSKLIVMIAVSPSLRALEGTPMTVVPLTDVKATDVTDGAVVSTVMLAT